MVEEGRRADARDVRFNIPVHGVILEEHAGFTDHAMARRPFKRQGSRRLAKEPRRISSLPLNTHASRVPALRRRIDNSNQGQAAGISQAIESVK